MADESDISLQLDVEEAPSAAIVVGIAEADDILARLEGLAKRQVPKIILDLSRMDFICSAGLGAIISAHLKSRHYDGRILLVDPKPEVRKLFETTRLTKLFPLHRSIEEAMSD